MGFYSNFIFPRICDVALGSRIVSEHRSKLLSEAEGDLLEIGFGTGLNLPHYPKDGREIIAIDCGSNCTQANRRGGKTFR